ncbi:Hypothetical protein SCF082_LOCUS24378 [Durusdinium trenchii]|uniref:Uncharacterized protein n=1 Tax=Durusdinium trenchii TaxID=1381693 RepID=A0ABP0LUC2_9DINO
MRSIVYLLSCGAVSSEPSAADRRLYGVPLVTDLDFFDTDLVAGSVGATLTWVPPTVLSEVIGYTVYLADSAGSSTGRVTLGSVLVGTNLLAVPAGTAVNNSLTHLFVHSESNLGLRPDGAGLEICDVSATDTLFLQNAAASTYAWGIPDLSFHRLPDCSDTAMLFAQPGLSGSESGYGEANAFDGDSSTPWVQARGSTLREVTLVHRRAWRLRLPLELSLEERTEYTGTEAKSTRANAHLVQALKEAGSGKRPAPKSAAEDMADKRARMEENPALTPKTELNSLIGKIAKKVLAKGETIYVSNRIGNQYQATVQSVALPDEWAQRAWAGELCATRQKAEQSAAEQALKDIKTDPVLMAEAMTVKNKQGAKVPVGKKGWGYMMEMMKNFLQNGGTAMFREAVTTDFVTGSVIEWKGKFGWIKPDSPIDHEWAKYRDGKIWVSKQDLSGLEELSEGQRVQFKVYVDPSGLGAEETSLA